MPRKLTEHLEVHPALVLSALDAAGARLGWSVTGVEDERRAIRFNTGTSWRNWKGIDVIAIVTPEGSGASMSVSAEMAGGQSYDWGETGSMVKALLSEVEEVLASDASAPALTAPDPQVESNAPVGELRQPTTGQRLGRRLLPALLIGLLLFFAVSMLVTALSH